MIKCKEVAHQASAYLDGDLPLMRRWSIWLHLKMCQHCERFVEQLKVASDIFRTYEQQSPSPAEIEQTETTIKNISSLIEQEETRQKTGDKNHP